MRRPAGFQRCSTILVVALGGAAVACGSEAADTKAAGGGAGSSVGGDGVVMTGGSASGGGAGPTSSLTLPSGDKPTPRLHRLTASEMAHSLQDLLGVEVPVKETEPDTRVDGFSSIGAGQVAVSPAGVGQYEQATLAATSFVFADPARVSAQLPCVPQSTTDAACLSNIVGKFGRRAFRRPLTEAEVQRYTALATTIGNREGSTVLAGVRHAISAILQSPSFVYRVELGAPSAADGGRLKYTDFEMASRLAATFWDSVPDDALLDVAAAGMLATPEAVKAQAERLLTDPKAERSIAAFTDELFGLHHLAEAIKDPTLFPTWQESLKDSMQHELERRVVDMVFTRKGDFLSLYDDRSTFVNDELARYYGLPESGQSGFYRAEFPVEARRAGLLGAGAILAGHALPSRTSPTARGKFVAEALLCRIVPPPPDMIPPLPEMAGPDSTLRERLTLHRQSPACAGCHALMDPMGFGMEDFDSAGLYRSMEGSKPIDATGELVGDGLDGSAFNGLVELGQALRKQPVMGPCLVSKLYAEAQGRRAIELDRAPLTSLAESFAVSQNRVDLLLVSLVTSEAFRFVEPTKG